MFAEKDNIYSPPAYALNNYNPQDSYPPVDPRMAGVVQPGIYNNNNNVLLYIVIIIMNNNNKR